MVDIIHLKSVLEYNPDTGVFTWKVNRGPVKAGDIAGGLAHEYLMIRYNMIKYLAHRLAWFYMTNTWPTFQIDHINGNKQDNRWSNLRESTYTQNAHNKEFNSNILGYRGIYKAGTKYAASIKINNITHYLGMYRSAIEAAKAYENKAMEVHGDFYKKPEYFEDLKNVIPEIIKQSNSTGFMGVGKVGNKYRAYIKIKGIKVHLGTFNTAEEAYMKYLEKRKEVGR